MNQKGQIIIILLLVMVVALAIGLSVMGRSITEISTSTNSENSYRAFSAAEAGMENILYDSTLIGLANTGSRSIDNTKLTNNATAEIKWDTNMPQAGLALEYPPFGKESFAQFWLADPASNARSYEGTGFDLYFGDPNPNPPYTGNNDPDYPAIEVRIITYSRARDRFDSTTKFFDSQPAGPRSDFTQCSGGPFTVITNNNTQLSSFLCKRTISGLTNDGLSYPIMVRVRMLYTNTSHPVALQPTTKSLPFQAKIFDSKGASGNVQRNIKVFQEMLVLPHIFDYAVFSLGKIDKQL